ncbi:MAG: S9 family peptidase [Candidatus Aminicenantes bacterium]|nr:MAG: S9 family peptidase [Candidatus Aminicenantes bacterium]
MEGKRYQVFMIASLLLVIIAAPISSTNQDAQEISARISSWLALGPFHVPLPAFHEDKVRGFTTEDLLKFDEVDVSELKPSADSSLKLHDGTQAYWKEIRAEENGISLEGDPHNPSTAYLGIYLDVRRWTKAKIILKSPQMFRIYLDGKVVATKATVQNSKNGNDKAEGRQASANLRLETGKHLILVKTVADPKSNSDWTIKAHLTFDNKFASPPPPPRFSLSPEQTMTIGHLLDGPKVTNVSIAPDGTLAALTTRQTLPPSDDSETWVEMYRVEDGSLIQTYKGGTRISRVNWAPSGKKFSYTTYDKSGGTIWIVDLEAGTTAPLLKDVKNLGNHVWAPDSSFIIYSVIENGNKDKASGVKRFKNLADRQPRWRDRSYLYKIFVPDGIRQRLTAGEISTNLNTISPDGKTLLFSRSLIDYSERPFSKTELFSLDLKTLETQLLWKGKWFNQAQWGPDGKKILVLGGPEAFGKTGTNVSKGVIPNAYDTQAYLFDPVTKDVESLTQDFNPTINQAFWSQIENCIYFITTDRSYVRLYQYNLDKKEFSPIQSSVEVIHRLDLARNKPVAIYTGSSAATPPKAYILDLQSKDIRFFKDPGKEDFATVEFGKVDRWTFKNKKGVRIEGRIYYPPGFDPSKKYPCIVYYYGGTSPVTRDFGGRYPKNLYAAQGYVVYVLQPSGAVGFGQKFSALHVNDWGIIVADEIIHGTKEFLKAHPFVDPNRVGCIGASYGGFMTMLLLTRTNMFASAVAHAGISSISSYWGEGYWGYAYSSIATANSYPWNRKDIYVNQSALFNADKITTPLLLLHGSVDTNVPPGESTQMFTALKILGKEVEYIQILDQNHHIMTYNKRIIWTKTIMAWFDRWLKKQSDWWVDLYPIK